MVLRTFSKEWAHACSTDSGSPKDTANWTSTEERIQNLEWLETLGLFYGIDKLWCIETRQHGAKLQISLLYNVLQAEYLCQINFNLEKNKRRKMQEGSCNNNNKEKRKENICLRKSLSCRLLEVGRAAVSLCLAHFHCVPWEAIVGHHWKQDVPDWFLGWLSAVAPVSNTCRQRSALINFPYPWFDSDGNTSP